MQFQVKLLRRDGVRRADSDIAASPWVVVLMETVKGPEGKRLCIFPMNAVMHMHPQPVRELFQVTLGSMDAESVTYSGIERSLGPSGAIAAVVQEWKVTRSTIGPGGLTEARERNVFTDVALL